MAKIINAVFGGGLFATTAKVFQYDVGDKLRFLGVDLPDGYSVDFANSRTGASTTVYGDADGVEIPPEYFIPGTEIYAWVVISDADGHYTKYQAKIPIYERAARTSVEPTPAQADALDEAINALNSAVEDVQDIADNLNEQINTALEEAKESGEFDGPQGPEGPQGPQGPTGESGTPGNSLWHGGEIRVYGTIPYYYLEDLSGRTDVEPIVGDLIVSNVFWLWQIKRISGHIIYISSLGSLKGTPGEDGYSPTVTVTEITGGHRVTITDAEGDHVFDVMDGQGGGGGVTVDDEISGSSTNPVQNKVIKAALDEKANASDVPTKTSDLQNDSGYLTQHQSLAAYRTAAAQDAIDDARDTAIAAKYTKPSGGIPASDLAAGVIPTVPTKTSDLTNDSGFVNAAGAAAAAPVQSVNGQTGAVTLTIPSTAAEVGAMPAVTEVTVATDGAVTQALDAGKIYHFTGALTALTITLNAAPSGQLAQYHFDFNCGSTAPTVTIPASVTMPDGSSFDANKHYEVDILNNFGAVMAWATS